MNNETKKVLTAKQMAKRDLAKGPMTLTRATESRFWRAYRALVAEGFATMGPESARGSVVFTIVRKG